MLNFTVGPVQSFDEIKDIGCKDVPYFRTSEFSEIMLENEKLMLEFSKARENDKAVFITGSGTASMEAAIINLLNANDNVLVVNGGSFGQRFVELLELHKIKFTQIELEAGHNITDKILNKYDGCNYTAFIVNIHETSTGVYYDKKLISNFCKKNNLFLIVDAISSFMADDFNFSELGVDVMIAGSQKAFACPPGISIMVLSENAQQRIFKNTCPCLYLDLKQALKNQLRGQTPFTPAVGILLQINSRLKTIKNNGGVESEIARTKTLAKYFRDKINSLDLPFKMFSDSMSNAVTAIKTTSVSAYDVFIELKDNYGIWICPNSGELKDTVFRVGHIGNLTKCDYDKLFEAFIDMHNKKII